MVVFPEEIMEKILSKLPAKSLVRFTSVCKHWCSLISDPNFVRTHLNNVVLDQSNRHRRLVLRSKSNANLNFIYSVCNAKPERRDFPLPVPDGLKVVGSVNGLLCIALGEFRIPDIVLWNPLSKICNTLPNSHSIEGVEDEVLGFGYDSSVDDYKIVKVFTQYMLLRNKVEIYSLKTNSWKKVRLSNSWKKVRLLDVPSNAAGFITGRNIGTHVNGSIYWCAKQYFDNGDQYIKMIVCFDLMNEKFRFLELPRDLMEEKVKLVELVEEKERLLPLPLEMFGDHTARREIRLIDAMGCLGLFQGCSGLSQVCMWTMKEDNNGIKFWSERMVISHPTCWFGKPVSFMKNGEVVLIKCKDKERKTNLAIYSKEKESFYDILSYDAEGWVVDAIYIETLVSAYNGGGGGGGLACKG